MSKRKPLSEIRALREPANRVLACRDLLAALTADRAALVDARDVAAMASIVFEGHSVSEVVERMGVWRTAWVKARARVKARHPQPSLAWSRATDEMIALSHTYGYVPAVPDAWETLKRAQAKIDKIDAYVEAVRAVRDAGCQDLADAGWRNFQIRDAAGVSSSYISQMGLGRSVETIRSAQQARKALTTALAAGNGDRAGKVRALAAERSWDL